MKTYTAADFKAWGSQGGAKSKRVLTAEQAKAMVSAREKKRRKTKRVTRRANTMKTILRTIALGGLATYLGVTTVGLRVLRESLPTATPTPAAGSSDWWSGALASETNRWSTLARIGKGVVW